MATTKEFNLTHQWTRCATGEGDVCLTAVAEALWIVTDSLDTPTLTSGHLARTGDNVPMHLSAGEQLWLKGSGGAVVTADRPVAQEQSAAMLYADDDMTTITEDDDTTPIEAA